MLSPNGGIFHADFVKLLRISVGILLTVLYSGTVLFILTMSQYLKKIILMFVAWED